jgi:Mn2+/Fe2+ NRAMP family transporter
LPIALAVILVAANKSSVVKNYKHPLLLQVIGWIVVAVMTWMSIQTFTH